MLHIIDEKLLSWPAVCPCGKPTRQHHTQAAPSCSDCDSARREVARLQRGEPSLAELVAWSRSVGIDPTAD